MITTIHAFAATTIDGRCQDLSEYAGRVVLVVNTASRCGFTPQYRGLQELQERYGKQGFTVLAFPCDQFGGQEPGSEDEIAAFCDRSFGVTFPMFAKVDVNGPDAHPLFEHLRASARGRLGSRIKWNFTKFLVARDGTVLRRYAPMTPPDRIATDIARALND